MPKSPTSICSFGGCQTKVDGKYCAKHKSQANDWANKKADPWYNRPIWKGNPNKPLGQRGGLRERQLLNTPYCEACKERDGIINDVTGKGKGVADHIKPFRSAPTTQEQWRLFTDMDNLQTLCRQHHDEKTRQEANR